MHIHIHALIHYIRLLHYARLAQFTRLAHYARLSSMRFLGSMLLMLLFSMLQFVSVKSGLSHARWQRKAVMVPPISSVTSAKPACGGSLTRLRIRDTAA